MSIDWKAEAGIATHEDFGDDVVRAVAHGMRKAYGMGIDAAVEAAKGVEVPLTGDIDDVQIIAGAIEQARAATIAAIEALRGK